MLTGSPEAIWKGLTSLEAAGVRELTLGFSDILQLASLPENVLHT